MLKHIGFFFSKNKKRDPLHLSVDTGRSGSGADAGCSRHTTHWCPFSSPSWLSAGAPGMNDSIWHGTLPPAGAVNEHTLSQVHDRKNVSKQSMMLADVYLSRALQVL